MAKKKTKKQIEQEEFEELKRKALEPFKPTLTKEKQLEHEEEIRERSIDTIRKMKDDVSESEMVMIKSRACFEHNWN